MVFLAELATPFLLVVQKTSYKLIDIGTLRGPHMVGKIPRPKPYLTGEIFVTYFVTQIRPVCARRAAVAHA